MFDLFRSRDKAVKYLMGGILGIVALSMVTYLVPSYNDQNGTAANPVLVEVGSEKITALEAQKLFEQNVTGQLPPEMMEVYFPQFLDRLTSIRAVMYQAKQLGVTATDPEVQTAILTSYGQFVQNGKLNRDAFEQALAQQGKSLQGIIDEVRQGIVVAKLQKAVVDSAVISPQEVEAEFHKRFDKATVQYIAFPPADFKSQVVISEEELKKNFESNKATYAKPEKFGYRVALLDQARIAASIQVTEADLRAAYSSALDNFRKPERVHARHILFLTQGKTDAEKAAQKTKADNMLKQLRAGGDFAALAKANSEDSGNAQNGGDLGWHARGEMDPAFDAAIFAAKPKDILEVITSAVGYHVAQVVEKEAASVTPFDSVRADVEKDLRAQKVVEKTQIAGDQLHAELVKTPANFEAIAQKYGAQVITVTEGAPGDPIPSLGVTPEITNSLATMKPGGVTDLIELPGQRIAVAVLEARIPGSPATLDEVRAKVRDVVASEKSVTLARERAASAAERLKKGEDIDAVAKAVGAKATTAANFTRQDMPEGLGSAVYLEDAFTKPVGAVIGPVMMGDHEVVAKSTAQSPADTGMLTAQRAQIMDGLQKQKQQERIDLWLDGVLAKLTSDGKLVRHQDEIQRVMALYHK